jgi:hypothetical protein
VREAASHRAAIAHLQVADLRGALGDGSQCGAVELGCQHELVPGCERPDAELSASDLDAAERELADVDEERGPRDPELHDGEERLAARDRLRVGVGE